MSVRTKIEKIEKKLKIASDQEEPTEKDLEILKIVFGALNKEKEISERELREIYKKECKGRHFSCVIDFIRWGCEKEREEF
jgi:hypothetical protein